MPIEHTEVLPGEGWYAVAKRLGGSQANQQVKDRNANYLAAANGSKDISGPLYPDMVVWFNPAKLILAPPPSGPRRGDEPGTYVPTRDLVGTLTPLGDLRRVTGSQYIGGGSTEFENHDVIEGVHFLGAVTRKDNRPRLFRDCWFPSGVRSWDAFYGHWTFEDCQMGAEGVGLTQDGVKGHDYTARRCYVVNTSDGFGVFNTHRHGPVDVAIEACLVGPLHYHHDLQGRPEGSHNDGAQIQGGTRGRIVGNHFVMMKAHTSDIVPGDPFPDDPRLGGQGVMFNHGVAPVGDWLVDRNWFTGGGTAVNVGGASAPHGQPLGQITVTNNVTAYQIPHRNTGGYDMIFNSPNAERGANQTVTGNLRADGALPKIGFW